MKKHPAWPATISLVILFSGCAGNRTSPVTPPVSPAAAASKPFPGVVFQFPVADGTLPLQQELMPGAPREYRGGVHEGVDIYYKSGTSKVACNEPVLNAAEGWVIRSDAVWKAMTEKEYDSLTQRLKKVYDENLLDRLRGRQVWVRTPDGITVRYCHLESVAPGIEAGIRVNPGVVIGAIGNTGTADGARLNGRNCHLHLEIWMPDGKFLGKGLSPRETREAWNALFGFSAPAK